MFMWHKNNVDLNKGVIVKLKNILIYISELKTWQQLLNILPHTVHYHNILQNM